MTVLLIGADGFIGSNVKKALVRASHAVYSAVREPSDVLELGVDLTDQKSIEAALRKVEPDVIINCAGVVDNSNKSKLNIVFATNLMQAIVASGVRPEKIIISGSAAEYGIVDPKNIPVNEDVPLNAQEGYGESKRLEVETCLELGAKHNLPVVVARIFNPIGAGMHPRFLIPKLIEQVSQFTAGERQNIEVNRLDSKRDYVDVRDIATAITQFVANKPKHAVYNIGSGKSASNGELIELILNNSTLDGRPEIVETASQKEPLVANQADIKRLSDEFGWKPVYTLEQTIKEIMHATNR